MMDARGLNRRGHLCRRLIIGTGQHGWRRAGDYSIRMREQQLADQFERSGHLRATDHTASRAGCGAVSWPAQERGASHFHWLRQPHELQHCGRDIRQPPFRQRYVAAVH